MSQDINATTRKPTRAKRPRSGVTSGRRLLDGGDPNSPWSRRYSDLARDLVSDLSGGAGIEALSAAQVSLVRRCAALTCELEAMEAGASRGEAMDVDRFGRALGNLRRGLETLGIERKPTTTTKTLDRPHPSISAADLEAERLHLEEHNAKEYARLGIAPPKSTP